MFLLCLLIVKCKLFIIANLSFISLYRLYNWVKIDRLKVFGIDKYHRTKKIVNSDKKKLNEFGIKKLHDNLPFLKYEEGKFVKWNNYVERIFSHLSEEERLELKNKNNIDIHEIHKQDIIVNYTVMSPSMIQKLNTIWQNWNKIYLYIWFIYNENIKKFCY